MYRREVDRIEERVGGGRGVGCMERQVSRIEDKVSGGRRVVYGEREVYVFRSAPDSLWYFSPLDRTGYDRIG